MSPDRPHSATHFGAVIQCLAVGVLIADTAGSPLEWNAIAADLFGWRRPAGDNGGENRRRLPRALDALRRRVLDASSSASVILRRGSAARQRWLRVHAALMTDTPGDDPLLLFTVHDETNSRALIRRLQSSEHHRSARKRVEERLRASKERFRLLAEGVRDHAIMMLDPHGYVTSWNIGAERMTGYSAHEAVRQHVSAVFPVDDGVDLQTMSARERAAEQGRAEHEGWRVRKDGSRFWASVALTALHDPNGRVVGFAAIVRDLTERRAAEEALRRSEENLRQAQKMDAIGRLAGGIAHDFNNLLTTIQGHSQFMLEELPQSATSHADAFEIKRAADRASALTRQLLIFSRKQVLEPQVLDLNLIVREMHSLLRRVIREDIALETELADDLWPIRADVSQMEQVLMNLTVNARDAMPSGGIFAVRTRNLAVQEEIDLAGSAVAPGRYVQVVVSDSGIGMSAETKARVFEPFFTTKPEGEGTGLGLATVYGIVRQSGGSISVYSEPGRGTTFRILFPACDPESAAEQPAEVHPAELARGWESIMVVEDDPGIRTLTSRALQGRGYSVLEAESGHDALRLAGEYDGPIDLVITDIIMPEMSGRRLAESMLELHPSTRLLFMSGFTPDEVVRQGLVDPQAKFIEKPFSPDKLARKVREVLDEPP